MRLIYLLLLLLASISMATQACQLTLRVYQFPPFAMKDKQGDWDGSDLRFARALGAQAGCVLNLLEASWARSIDMLKTGGIDMMVSVTKSAEREKFFHYIGPMRIETIRLVSKQGKLPEVTEWQQLETMDAILMRQRGSYFGPRFDQMLLKNPTLRAKMFELTSNDVRLDLIYRGRVAGVFVDEAYISYLGQFNPQVRALKVHPLPINQGPVYYAFSKASVDDTTLARLQKAFNELVKTDTFEQIEAHFHPRLIP